MLRLDLQAAKVTLSNRDKMIPRSRPKSRASTRSSPDCFLRVFQSRALVPRFADRLPHFTRRDFRTCRKNNRSLITGSRDRSTRRRVARFADDRLFPRGEPVAGRIQQPWIVIRTLHASEETQSLAGQLSGRQRASVRQRAVGQALLITGLLPVLEISERRQLGGLLHPLNHLEEKRNMKLLLFNTLIIVKNVSLIFHLNHSDEVHVAPGDHLLDELDQLFLVLFLTLQPGCVEVQTERRPVAVEVPVEVVSKQTSELLAALDVGAGVDHVTTRQGLVEGGIVPAVQLVHHHLPDWMRPRRAVAAVAIALVGHPEVQRVRPNRHTSQRRGDGGVVHEKLIGHHLELLVTADSEIRGSHADDGAVGDVGETLDDQSGAGHLRQPIVVRTLAPVLRILLVRQREHRDLVAASMKILHRRIVGVLVGDEERTADLAAIRVLTLPVEDLVVEIDVVHVHGAVEGDRDHLRHLLGIDVAGYTGAVGRTIAIGQDALRGIAIRSTVGIGLHRCNEYDFLITHID